MADRKLFGSNKLIEDFTAQLTKVDTLEGGWSNLYQDEKTGNCWLKYVVDERGFYENLILISPKPTTEELIDIAFSSCYPNEVGAAVTRLQLEEQTHKSEYRQKLIEKLSRIDILNLNVAEQKRIKTIIQASQLTDKVNQREIVGKHFSEIEEDAAFFAETANKAQQILSKLKLD